MLVMMQMVVDAETKIVVVVLVVCCSGFPCPHHGGSGSGSRSVGVDRR